ncbi:MAG: hypothetical protein ACTSWY_08760 [Promethearchaeota archaeon]
MFDFYNRNGIPSEKTFEMMNNNRKKSFQFLSENDDLNSKLKNHLEAQYYIKYLDEGIDWLDGLNFPLTEAHIDIRGSIRLTCEGFYKQTTFNLRSSLELTLLHAFTKRNKKNLFDIKPFTDEKVLISLEYNETVQKKYIKWLYSKKPTDEVNKYLKFLRDVREFKEYDKEFALFDKIRAFYSYLSDFIHTKGLKYSSYTLNKSNMISFNPVTFRVMLINICHSIKFNILIILILNPVGRYECLKILLKEYKNILWDF